jgi:hypothetical protein
MHISLTLNPSKQRAVLPYELKDDIISDGDFFGTTGANGSRVWHLDGAKAVLVGVSDPDHRSMAILDADQTLRDALRTVPMLADSEFCLHRMLLPPGAHYPRIARPNDQHPNEAPGACPDFWSSRDVVVGSLNQVRFLVAMLDAIFQAVHPVAANMSCFGSSIRNLLILACTECEAQWRGVLQANGHLATSKNFTTNDYVKLLPAMRLNEYAVKLNHYPWLLEVAPFLNWNTSKPTQTIGWYDDYNAVKHDRENAFNRANLESAINAVAAVWIMVAAQFGIQGMREFDDLFRYFQLERVPLWRYSEVYTHGCDGHKFGAGQKNFNF